LARRGGVPSQRYKSWKKKTDALHIPVVNIETPPLEINLQRKASSLLRNVNRASVSLIGDCGSPE